MGRVSEDIPFGNSPYKISVHVYITLLSPQSLPSIGNAFTPVCDSAGGGGAGGLADIPGEDTPPLQRTVRILLECILVGTCDDLPKQSILHNDSPSSRCGDV